MGNLTAYGMIIEFIEKFNVFCLEFVQCSRLWSQMKETLLLSGHWYLCSWEMISLGTL